MPNSRDTHAHSGNDRRSPLSGRTVAIAGVLTVGALVLLITGGAFHSETPADQAAPPSVGTTGNAQCASGQSFYVAPNGAAGNAATIEQPLDLKTALSEKSPAKPCDTIWLRGGKYSGSFISRISGKPGAPVFVREYAGERATLDSAPSKDPALMVDGNHVWFWGFEVTNSDPQRTSAETGAWPGDLRRGTGIVTRGADVKFINLVIHDLARGIEVASPAMQTPSAPPEIYGNLIYNNGFDGVHGSIGNGVETQNRGAQQLIADNIMFNQYSHGILALASSDGRVDNLAIVGNVVFNNGLPGRGGLARDILVGGAHPAMNPILRDNATYGGAQTFVGHGTGCTNAVIAGNYFVGSTPLLLEKCTGTVKDNHLYGQYGFGSLPQTFQQNTYLKERPQGVVVRYRRNTREPGRAHIIVYNWDKHAAVTVDLTEAGLNEGDQYEIRDAQNLYGEALVARTFTGDSKVNIPMEGLSVAAPIGRAGTLAHTAPEFGVFVVRKLRARAATQR